jgi:hypothetical protein
VQPVKAKGVLVIVDAAGFQVATALSEKQARAVIETLQRRDSAIRAR